MSHSAYADSATFYCAFCGEPNDIEVDPFVGRVQVYVEDCQVCCRPNVLRLTFDEDFSVTVSSAMES